MKNIESQDLPEDADLETIMHFRIDYLNKKQIEHEKEAARYKGQANELRDILRQAGIKI